MDFSVGSNAKEQQRANLFALKNYCNALSSCFAQAGDRGGLQTNSKQKTNKEEGKKRTKNHVLISCFAQAGDTGGVRQGEQLKQQLENNAERLIWDNLQSTFYPNIESAFKLVLMQG